MLLRELPITKYQTVHPFPWLFAREKQGDLNAAYLLDQEVSHRYVWSGGLLIYVQDSGNWDVIHKGQARKKVVAPKHVICSMSDTFIPKYRKPTYKTKQ